MIITSEFFSFNVWEWFLHSSVLERTEFDLSKINWIRCVILLNPIVLVPWGRFLLCHTPIRPILAFRDQISILIVGCVTTWSRGSHPRHLIHSQHMLEVRNFFWFDCLVSFDNLSILPCKWEKLISILSSIYWFVKVASILIPQAKPLYPCLLFEKTLFSPDDRSVVTKLDSFLACRKLDSHALYAEPVEPYPFRFLHRWLYLKCWRSKSYWKVSIPPLAFLVCNTTDTLDNPPKSDPIPSSPRAWTRYDPSTYRRIWMVSSCSKWSNDSVQDKGIERGIECIGFECFNQIRIERSIRVSRGDPSTSYPCARGVQHNLIWAMRWGQ